MIVGAGLGEEALASTRHSLREIQRTLEEEVAVAAEEESCSTVQVGCRTSTAE